MRKYSLAGIVVILMLFVVGCGGSKRPEYVMGQHYYTGESQEEVTETATEEAGGEENTQEAESETIPDNLYLIMKNDMETEMLILKQLSTGKQYMYYYSFGTKFLDKYANHTSVVNFDVGRAVKIGQKDAQGKLDAIQISDDVWEYDDVSKYAIDLDYNMFTYAGDKYRYDNSLLVNSDDTILDIADLNQKDTLRVIGVGKKLLSLTVTTGHGTLSLVNTELFEGSYIQIGTKIFSEITPDMQMELAEGTYTVTVANDGYGGSTDITVERGQTVTLDLDTLKGEGPKYCNVAFVIAGDGASLMVDGQSVDFSQTVSLKYGVHSIIVNVPGYDTWSKYLYVNSSEATIVIDPTESDSSSDTLSDSASTDSTTSQDDSTTNSNATTNSNTTSNTGIDGSGTIRESLGTGTSSGTSSGSSTNSSSSDSTGSSSSSSSNTDYLSTLSQLLSSFTNSNSNSQ